MHRIQKTVEGLELSLESDQCYQLHTHLRIIEILVEFVVDIHLYQPLMLQVFVVRVGADTADTQITRPVFERELDQIHTVRVLLQGKFSRLVHQQVSSWKT